MKKGLGPRELELARAQFALILFNLCDLWPKNVSKFREGLPGGGGPVGPGVLALGGGASEGLVERVVVAGLRAAEFAARERHGDAGLLACAQRPACDARGAAAVAQPVDEDHSAALGFGRGRD